MNNSRKWQKILIIPLFLFLFCLASFPWSIWVQLTPYLTMLEGEEYLLDLNSFLKFHIKGSKEGIIQVNDKVICLEGDSLRGPLSMKALQFGQVVLEFQLFGAIPLRQITVNVLPEKSLMPGGHSIGIKLKSEGVMVTGYNLLEGENGKVSPGEEVGIKIGDVIIEINDVRIKDLAQVTELMEKNNSAEGSLHLTVKRDNRILQFELSPLHCRNSDTKRIGLYLRDTTAGVGTLTFHDLNTGIYGALGHVITDLETNKPIVIEEGQIVRADIVSINEARRGSPGEKSGVFVEGEDIIGNIEKNTSYGIFGRLNITTKHPFYRYPLPVGLRKQVKPGEASILTVIAGDKIERFDIKIEKVYSHGDPGNKGMIIRITDEKLLAATGGIVQGMSGSPIIQDGKLVGAVTHVFVNDPTKGYGIFLEWMLVESGILEARDSL